jgi:hypothetical protein
MPMNDETASFAGTCGKCSAVKNHAHWVYCEKCQEILSEIKHAQNWYRLWMSWGDHPDQFAQLKHWREQEKRLTEEWNDDRHF